MQWKTLSFPVYLRQVETQLKWMTQYLKPGNQNFFRHIPVHKEQQKYSFQFVRLFVSIGWITFSVVIQIQQNDQDTVQTSKTLDI